MKKRLRILLIICLTLFSGLALAVGIKIALHDITILPYYLLAVFYFILMNVIGVKLGRQQMHFINYLKNEYPNKKWREVLFKDPYDLHGREPGFAILSYFYITKEDFNDPRIKKMKVDLKKTEFIYAGLFFIGIIAFFIIFIKI
ncbi:MAG: hypothetical protein ACMUJM_20685 [bacterium]